MLNSSLSGVLAYPSGYRWMDRTHAALQMGMARKHPKDSTPNGQDGNGENGLAKGLREIPRGADAPTEAS